MTERRDLVTLSRVDTPWRELPSSERINLRAVEMAYVGLAQDKLFQRVMEGRGVTQDDFLGGVTSLDVLTDRIETTFDGSLSDKGRERLGRSVLKTVVGDGPVPNDLNGDAFAVKEQLKSWVQRDLGVDKNFPNS